MLFHQWTPNSETPSRTTEYSAEISLISREEPKLIQFRKKILKLLKTDRNLVLSKKRSSRSSETLSVTTKHKYSHLCSQSKYSFIYVEKRKEGNHDKHQSWYASNFGWLVDRRASLIRVERSNTLSCTRLSQLILLNSRHYQTRLSVSWNRLSLDCKQILRNLPSQIAELHSSDW